MALDDDELSGRRVVGLVLFGLFVGLPGLVVFTNTEKDEDLIPVCAAIATLGGGIGFIVAAERRLLALLPGPLAGAGAFAATLGYTSLRDDFLRTGELAIPLVLGSLPAVGLYWLLYRLVPRRKRVAAPGLDAPELEVER